MNETYLVGRLNALAIALGIEVAHLSENVDEDEHKRLVKLYAEIAGSIEDLRAMIIDKRAVA